MKNYLASRNLGFSLCAAPFDSQVGLSLERRTEGSQKMEFEWRLDGGDWSNSGLNTIIQMQQIAKSICLYIHKQIHRLELKTERRWSKNGKVLERKEITRVGKWVWSSGILEQWNLGWSNGRNKAERQERVITREWCNEGEIRVMDLNGIIGVKRGKSRKTKGRNRMIYEQGER